MELPQWYVKEQKRIAHCFTYSNFKGLEGKSRSPCGQYHFVIERYGTDPRWSYYRGVLYDSKRELVELRSTAHKFWHCWVSRNDKVYLVCNENTQGYTIVDVEKHNVYPYIDPRAKNGYGFSWKTVKPSPDGKLLAVQGDYMESRREILLYDFTNPTLPLPIIRRIDDVEKGYCILKDWKNEKTIVMEHKCLNDSTTICVSI